MSLGDRCVSRQSDCRFVHKGSTTGRRVFAINSIPVCETVFELKLRKLSLGASLSKSTPKSFPAPRSVISFPDRSSDVSECSDLLSGGHRCTRASTPTSPTLLPDISTNRIDLFNARDAARATIP